MACGIEVDAVRIPRKMDVQVRSRMASFVHCVSAKICLAKILLFFVINGKKVNREFAALINEVKFYIGK